MGNYLIHELQGNKDLNEVKRLVEKGEDIYEEHIITAIDNDCSDEIVLYLISKTKLVRRSLVRKLCETGKVILIKSYCEKNGIKYFNKNSCIKQYDYSIVKYLVSLGVDIKNTKEEHQVLYRFEQFEKIQNRGLNFYENTSDYIPPEIKKEDTKANYKV